MNAPIVDQNCLYLLTVWSVRWKYYKTLCDHMNVMPSEACSWPSDVFNMSDERESQSQFVSVDMFGLMGEV